MAASSPMSWGTIEDAIYTWFNGQTGIDTIWANQNAPRPAYPYAVLNIDSGPMPEGWDEHRSSVDLTVATDVKVTPVASNSVTYTITINGTDFNFTADADATVAEITAGLKAVIDLGSEPVTVTDNNTDLDIESDSTATFTIVVSDDGGGSALLSWVNNDIGREIANNVTGYREMTLSCQVLVRDTASGEPTSDAKYYMSIAQSSLQLPTVRSALRTAGIAVIDRGSILDISAEIEDEIESRAQMDVRLRIVSSMTERTGYIGSVDDTEGTFNGSNDSPITETVTFE